MAGLIARTRSHVPSVVEVLAGASLGTLGMFGMLVLWRTMAGSEQPLLWWAGRALGLLAYVALLLSMLFGILVSSKGFGRRLPTNLMMSLHQEWTLAAVIATVLHVVVLVTHAESGVTPWAAVIPFASDTLRGPVTLGTVSTIMLGLVVVSSWVRDRVPYGAWRAIHGLAFGATLLAIAHSVTAGTDTDLTWVRALYLGTGAALLIVLFVRIGIALAPQATESRRSPTASHL